MDCPLQYYGIDLLSEAKESGYTSFTEELPGRIPKGAQTAN